jgi:hypothetical protein
VIYYLNYLIIFSFHEVNHTADLRREKKYANELFIWNKHNITYCTQNYEYFSLEFCFKQKKQDKKVIFNA